MLVLITSHPAAIQMNMDVSKHLPIQNTEKKYDTNIKLEYPNESK